MRGEPRTTGRLPPSAKFWAAGPRSAPSPPTPSAATAVRLQLHAPAYNLGNFVRTLAMPKTAQPWSLTSLREKLIKIGAKVVSQAADVCRYPVADAGQ